MLGFDNDEEEHLFLRKLTGSVLCLSPVVVAILMGFSPPTYGKHVTAKSKKSALAEQGDKSKEQTQVSPTTSDTSSLGKLGGPSYGTTSTSDESVDESSKKSQCDKQKEQKHWLGPLFPAKWS